VTRVGVSGGRGRECLGALLQRRKRKGCEGERRKATCSAPIDGKYLYTFLSHLFFYF